VDAVHVLELRTHHRHELLGDGREAQPGVALGLPRPRERLPDQLHRSVGDPPHPLAHDPRHLREALRREPGVDELLQELGALQVVIAVDLCVVGGHRQPERLPLGLEHLDRDARFLGELDRAVLVLGAQHLLDRQQRQALLDDRALQLLERDPGLVELLEQVEPGRASITLQPVEQPLGLEVRRGYAPSRSISRRRSSGSTAGEVSSMKSSSARAKRRGLSRCGKCPARGKVTSLLPGIASFARRPCRNGMTGSRSPQTISDGISAAR
jgi:hypothetical protein